MIKTNDKELIRQFRRFLDDNMYDRVYAQICGKINYCVNPWQTEELVLNQLLLCTEKQNVIYKLLLLGHSMNYEDVCEAIGQEIVPVLIELGIIQQEENLLHSEYSIVAFHDRYFVVDLPYYYSNCKKKMTDVYIGFDSYDLANFLPLHKGGSMLDLCSGSGIQGIMLASQADEVNCVEYNEKVVPYTIFNTILNGVDEMTTVYHGSVYGPVGDKTYDVIVSNPPFVPVPEDIEYPMCGDGSEDGLSIIREIVTGFKTHLNDDGCAMMIGECIGGKQDVMLYDMLQEILDQDFDVKLMLHGRSGIVAKVEDIAKVYAMLNDDNPECLNEARKKWYQMFKKLHAEYYYCFTLKVRKHVGMKSRFELLHPDWQRSEASLFQ